MVAHPCHLLAPMADTEDGVDQALLEEPLVQEGLVPAHGPNEATGSERSDWKVCLQTKFTGSNTDPTRAKDFLFLPSRARTPSDISHLLLSRGRGPTGRSRSGTQPISRAAAEPSLENNRSRATLTAASNNDRLLAQRPTPPLHPIKV